MIPGRHSINIDLYFQRYNQDHLNCQSRQRCAFYMSLQIATSIYADWVLYSPRGCHSYRCSPPPQRCAVLSMHTATSSNTSVLTGYVGRTADPPSSSLGRTGSLGSGLSVLHFFLIHHLPLQVYALVKDADLPKYRSVPSSQGCASSSAGVW